MRDTPARRCRRAARRGQALGGGMGISGRAWTSETSSSSSPSHPATSARVNAVVATAGL